MVTVWESLEAMAVAAKWRGCLDAAPTLFASGNKKWHKHVIAVKYIKVYIVEKLFRFRCVNIDVYLSLNIKPQEKEHVSTTSLKYFPLVYWTEYYEDSCNFIVTKSNLAMENEDWYLTVNYIDKLSNVAFPKSYNYVLMAPSFRV